MFDAVIDGRSYDLREARTKTLAAQALMTEFKVKELPVWYTKASLDEIEAQGDPQRLRYWLSTVCSRMRPCVE
jgi:hypothetical protein